MSVGDSGVVDQGDDEPNVYVEIGIAQKINLNKSKNNER
ncbi:MAG: hypothetical protein ACI9XK_000612 [Granulosicoccus sp.]|jgi:hypothetical protein